MAHDLNEHMFGSTDTNRGDMTPLLSAKTASIVALLERQPEPKIVGTLVASTDFTAAFLTALADRIHADNVKAGWWTDLETGEDLHGKRNIGELLALVHSEVSEALEGHRKRLMDDKLPHRPNFRVELIDAVIRLLDLLGSVDNSQHPAGTIFEEKRAFNKTRPDHLPENRLKEGGKVF